jgi:hypothetical protein
MIAASGAASQALPPQGPPAPYYVPLPRRLAEDLRDSPVAVGAYALIARLYRVTREPVPLSPADLRLLDPSLSYGAATRALRRLSESPYVVVSRGRGRKSAYAPAWGAVRGEALPWNLGAPCLGRPRHIAALRLEQRLLDTCLGRLRPHAEHPAVVERYLAEPLLGLADIGAYALALAGLPAEGDRLRRLGLLGVGGQPQPLPDDATILAVASQRAAGGDALTAAGWARVGMPAPEPAGGAFGQALFFVPKGQIGGGIGGGIGHPIGHPEGSELASRASGSEVEGHTASDEGSHGSIDRHGCDRSTTRPGRAGGGATKAPARTASLTERVEGDGPVRSPGEEPESCRLLREIGVRRSVREGLSHHSGEQVARAISQARARGDVRDLAGWVVSALRELPPVEDGPAVPDRPLSALPIYTHPGLSDEQRDRWIRRFRAALSPYDQRAVLARLEQEHPR